MAKRAGIRLEVRVPQERYDELQQIMNHTGKRKAEILAQLIRALYGTLKLEPSQETEQ